MSLSNFYWYVSLRESLAHLSGVKGKQQSPAVGEENLHGVVSQLPPALVYLLDLLVRPGEWRRLRFPMETLEKQIGYGAVSPTRPGILWRPSAAEQSFTWLSWASAALSSTKYIPDFPVRQHQSARFPNRLVLTGTLPAGCTTGDSKRFLPKSSSPAVSLDGATLMHLLVNLKTKKQLRKASFLFL